MENKKRAHIFVVVIFFVAMFMVAIMKQSTLEIYFDGVNSAAYDGQCVQLYWGSNQRFSENNSIRSDIKKRHASIAVSDIPVGSDLRLDFFQAKDAVRISRVELRIGVFTVRTYRGSDLIGRFTSYDISNVYADKDILVLEGDEHLQCNLSKDMSVDLLSRKDSFLYAHLSDLALLLLAIFFVLMMHMIYVKSDKYVYYCRVGLLLVFCLVVVMAFFSDVYGHPDEDEISMTIEYYMYNWKLPDFQSEAVAKSFSDYGTSRLAAKTIYYPLAGKFAWIAKTIFHITAYYRMMNVVMFGLFCLFIGRRVKEAPWSIALIFPTPQVWYLFSYATGDAFDYLLSAVLIYEVVSRNSMLNKCLAGEKKHWILPVVGFLFGLLWLGKQNYLMVFLTSFLVLLYYLIQNRDKAVGLIVKYVVILGTFGITVCIREVIDRFVYHGEKATLYRAAAEGKASLATLDSGTRLKERGYPLSNVLFERDFFKEAFESFFGRYGWMTEKSDTTYYVLLTLGILAILWIMIVTIRRHFDRSRIWYWGIFLLIVLIGWGALIYNAWCRDYQAQGRYLLPIIFGFAPLAELAQWELLKEERVCKISAALVVIFMYGFFTFGIIPLM